MGIFSRIWRLIRGWLLVGVEAAEDPEVILKEAQESMRAELAKAKENAVKAIAARNELRGVLQQQTEAMAQLEAKARAALRAGDEELAKSLLVEKATYAQNIEGLQSQLALADRAAESVKESIKTMETRVRQAAAKRLAMVAGWKQAKIQEQLSKALSGISLEGQESAFEAAEQKIREVKSRSDARMELAEGGLHQRMSKLDNALASEQAEGALASLKAEMGMVPAVTSTVDPLAKLKLELEEEPQTVIAGLG